MTTSTEPVTTSVAPVTRNCALGNHSRCMGVVTTPDGLVECGCKSRKCTHGSDGVKARRKAG